MKTTARSIAAAVAALVLTFAVGTGAAFAADPPTVGGTLSVSGNTITVFSNGNVPAHVTMDAEVVVLSETEFDLAPGETHELSFTSESATGQVTALYTVIPTKGQDAGSATLVLNLKPYVAPVNFGPILLGIAGLLAVMFLAYRVKPWRWRIVTTPPTEPSA